MWANLFGGSTATPAADAPAAEGQADAGAQISNFFSGLVKDTNSFFSAVAHPEVSVTFRYAHQPTRTLPTSPMPPLWAILLETGSLVSVSK